MRRAAILGFGRFGRALAGLLEEAGVSTRAYDPSAAIPSALRASSAAEAVADAELVIFAVPVAALRGALEAAAPALRGDQLVLDVASVKLGPARDLEEVLGARVPHVATHPLFGPASLARGERPMRVVIVPSALHPDAAARAAALFSALGCETLETSAEAHDRAMARTHVLTFFLAKALLDAGVGEGVPFAPPSFRALERVIDLVRIDAGHLFYAIQHENPFAGAERRRLIDALSNIDDRIRADRPPARAEPVLEPLSIPDLGAPTSELDDVRAQIDAVDRELLELLRRRAQLALRAGRAKAREGKPVRDEGRERALLEARERWAEALGLEGEAVREIYEAILRQSRGMQRKG